MAENSRWQISAGNYCCTASTEQSQKSVQQETKGTLPPMHATEARRLVEIEDFTINQSFCKDSGMSFDVGEAVRMTAISWCRRRHSTDKVVEVCVERRRGSGSKAATCTGYCTSGTARRQGDSPRAYQRTSINSQHRNEAEHSLNESGPPLRSTASYYW